MLRFIYKTLHHVRSAVRHSQSHSINFVPVHPNLKCVQSIDTSSNQHSFTASYLMNSCGFPLDKAISASRYLKFKAPEKPDSVLAFFNSRGFTKTQILHLVRVFPPVLLCDPEKTLLPKIEFFKSHGMSSADIATILSKNPDVFKRSLQNTIIPSFEFFNNLLQSKEKTIATFKRNARILSLGLKTYVIPNVEVLQEAGMPQKNIAFLLTYYPGVLLNSSNRFRKIVEDVKKMGFNPLKTTFSAAVFVKSSMGKSTWNKKLEVYKKWGWSEDKTLVAFTKNPWIMTTSEDKIMRIMDYLVNKMGQDSYCIYRNRNILLLSLERRIIPRCELHEYLLSKGLKKYNLLTMLVNTEEQFLQFLNSHEEAPKLLKLYKEKLALAR